MITLGKFFLIFLVGVVNRERYDGWFIIYVYKVDPYMLTGMYRCF